MFSNFFKSSKPAKKNTSQLRWEAEYDEDDDLVYDQEVVGESFYQDNLLQIAGEKTDESKEVECTALLVPEPENKHDRNAVAVYINNLKVGHLSRDDAADYQEFLQEFNITGKSVECAAFITGGWDRGERGEGDFSVRLSTEYPWELTE